MLSIIDLQILRARHLNARRPQLFDLSDAARTRTEVATDWRTFEERYAQLAFGLGVVPRRLQPDDPPQRIRDRLRAETRDVAIAGHFPYLPRLLALLTTGGEAGVDFPMNGVVALVTDDEGETFREIWRIEN